MSPAAAVPRSGRGGTGSTALRSAAAALCLAAVFLAGLAVKAHAGRADAHGLRWVLAPTVAVVEAVSGVAFEDDGAAGYLSRARRFTIVPACAGVNFFVVALWTLGFGFVRAEARPLRNAGVVVAGAAVAYGVTVLANAARIVLALALHAGAVRVPGLSPAALHRVEGVAVYLGVLCALFLVASRLAGRPARLAVPLACYLGVTLALPLLNGAGGTPAFWRHAGVVLLGVALVSLLSLSLRERVGADAIQGTSRRRRGDTLSTAAPLPGPPPEGEGREGLSSAGAAAARCQSA